MLREAIVEDKYGRRFVIRKLLPAWVAGLVILTEGTVEHGSEANWGRWEDEKGGIRAEAPGSWLAIGLVTDTVLQMGLVVIVRGEMGILLLKDREDGSGLAWACVCCSVAFGGMVMTIGLEPDVTGTNILVLVGKGFDKVIEACNGLFLGAVNDCFCNWAGT